MGAALELTTHEHRIGDLLVSHHRGERKTAVRAAIQAHLARSPFAGDTREGIVANWVASRCTDDVSDVVEEVLRQLVEEDVLERQPLPGGGFLYVGRGQASQR